MSVVKKQREANGVRYDFLFFLSYVFFHFNLLFCTHWFQIINDGCNAVIFFVSLEEFNVQSTEDAGKTKLQEAFETWKSTSFLIFSFSFFPFCILLVIEII